MKKRLIIMFAGLCVLFGGILTVRALEKPAPLCYNDPELGEEIGTCRAKVNGDGFVCVTAQEGDRLNCTGTSEDI